MAQWHYQLNGHEFDQTLGDSEGQRSLACYSPWGHKKLDMIQLLNRGFPGGSEVKVSACNAGYLGSIPGSGRYPGEGHGNPLQYSCLENPMDGGAQGAWGHKESDTTERLHFHFRY